MKKFSWGKVIDYLYFDFVDKKLEIIKYHPWKTRSLGSDEHSELKLESTAKKILVGQVNEEEIMYTCEELRESSTSLDYLIISWIARKNLGRNQYALVDGIARALEIKL